METAVRTARSFLQQRSCLHGLDKRCITTGAARELLGLTRQTFTPKTLRTAYLEAAKKCHPDTSDATKQQASEEFRQVTEAYELLLTSNSTSNHFTTDFGITEDEEAEFRRACQEILGLPAEIVEESKQCPAFRQWLSGKTDAAHYWKVFFMRYGGLAPKLRPSAGMIEGSSTPPPKSATRRRRPSQSTNL